MSGGQPADPAGQERAGQARQDERKLVTALVVGVTAPSAEAAPPGDPELVRVHGAEVMRQVTDRIHHYRGIVQTSAMGRLLAVFGADRSHDDDPERAVRAALDLLEGEHAVRAGVATGEAVVTYEPDGPDQVNGDVIHLALTLEQTAAPASVLVSAATHQATSRVLSYVPVEPAGGLELASGMRLWRAVQPRARTGAQVRRRAAPPLVERDRELAFLDGVLGRFLRDRGPQSVTVVSDPGLGKSRMVGELSRMVDNTPELVGWRVGHARAYGQGPLGALAEIVKAELGVLDGDDATTTRRKLDEGVTDLFGDDTGTITGSLGVLLGTVDTEQISSQRETLFDDWARYLAAVAEQRPLVMVCEDLQWADPTLLEFAGGLTGRVGPVPLLLMVTARPELLESAEGWGGGQPNAVTLTLAPLSTEGTGTLLDALLGDAAVENPGLVKELTDETREALLKAAGGNPLYVEEYVHMLAGQEPDADRPSAFHRGTSESATGRPAGRPLSMPTSVQQVIAARIDTLPPDDKRLLQNAAVVGESGWVGALAAVSGRGRDEVADGLRRLDWRDLLRRVRVSSVAGETEYTFRHTLIREVAYGQLLREERVDKHQRAARWLESLGTEAGERAELLTHHYGRALTLTRAAGRPTRTLTEQARRVSRMAGARAARFGSFAAAARAYRAALELWPEDDPERPDLLLGLGQSLVFSENTGEDVLDQARQAALAAGREDLVVEVDALHSKLARAHNRMSDAHERTRQSLDSPAPEPATLSAMVNHCIELMLEDRHAEATEAARRLVALAERHGRPDVEGCGIHIAGEIRLLRGDPGGFDDCVRGAELMDANQSPLILHAAYARARALWWYGDLERCAAVVRTAQERAETVDTYLTRWFDSVQASLDYAAGRWDAVTATADRMPPKPASGRVEATFRLARGSVALTEGRVDGALAEARAAYEILSPGDIRYRQATHALQGRCLLAAGRRDEAVACLEELLADQRKRPSESCATPCEGALLLDLDYPADALPAGLAPTRWHEAVRALVERDFQRAAELLDAIGAVRDAAAARARLRDAS